MHLVSYFTSIDLFILCWNRLHWGKGLGTHTAWNKSWSRTIYEVLQKDSADWGNTDHGAKVSDIEAWYPFTGIYLMKKNYKVMCFFIFVRLGVSCCGLFGSRVYVIWGHFSCRSRAGLDFLYLRHPPLFPFPHVLCPGLHLYRWLSDNVKRLMPFQEDFY